jgi:putative ABC transport system permease protein
LLVNHKIEATLDPGAIDWVRSQSNVQRIVTYRVTTTEIGGKLTGLLGTDVPQLLAAGSLPVKGKIAGPSFDPKSDCLISEPLAGRVHLGVGDSLALPTPSGQRNLRIAGIYYDFGAERGQVMLDRATYADLFHDDTITSLHVTLRPGSDRQKIAGQWMRVLRDKYPVVVSSFGQIQTEVMTVFDRTFMVTSVLSLLAGGVAFCGLAGSLLAVALARRRDYSILTAIGMSGRQTLLWVVAQGLVLAWTSAFVASIGGTVLAFVLSGVIQYRSFGWSIPTEAQPRYWVETFVLATVAALVATIYPVVRLRSIPPAGNLREE